MNISDRGFLALCAGEESSLRGGIFSRQSNLTTIASSERFKIASWPRNDDHSIGVYQW